MQASGQITDYRVMIADDSYFMRHMLRQILEMIGCTVVGEAQDGAEAVAKYAELRPQVVLMDVFMPLKDGPQAALEILAMDKNAKVIMCSTLDHESLADTALKVGAREVIFKPYHVDSIQEVLRKVMQD